MFSFPLSSSIDTASVCFSAAVSHILMLFLLLLPRNTVYCTGANEAFLKLPILDFAHSISIPYADEWVLFSLLTIRDLWKGIGRWRENILRRCLVLIGELVTFRCPNAQCIPLLNLGATYLVIYWRPHGWHVFQGTWRQKNKQALWKVHWGGALPTPSPGPAWLIASGEAWGKVPCGCHSDMYSAQDWDKREVPCK